MPSPTLHYHPLSSYCQKALVAIEALGVDVDLALYNPGDPAQREAFHQLWPTGKMPLLVDAGRVVAESSIIIEYLQRHHARNGYALIPEAVDAALEVRLWDRMCDQYVMTPMQALTADLLRPESDRDPVGVAKARADLTKAYGYFDRHLAGKTWLANEAFSLADCAAMPALFYAVAYEPIGPAQANLAGYFDRLMDHAFVKPVIDAARPFYQYFPGRDGLARRFYEPAAA